MFELTFHNPDEYVDKLLTVVGNPNFDWRVHHMLDTSILMALPMTHRKSGGFAKGFSYMNAYHYLDNLSSINAASDTADTMNSLIARHYDNMALLLESSDTGFSDTVREELRGRALYGSRCMKARHSNLQELQKTFQDNYYNHNTSSQATTVYREGFQILRSELPPIEYDKELTLLLDDIFWTESRGIEKVIRAGSENNSLLRYESSIGHANTLVHNHLHSAYMTFLEQELERLKKSNRWSNPERINHIYQELRTGNDDRILSEAILYSIKAGAAVNMLTSDRGFYSILDIAFSGERSQEFMEVMKRANPEALFAIKLYHGRRNDHEYILKLRRELSYSKGIILNIQHSDN